ncbi:hypothetical protein IAR55_003283 [Kwoniella newhampshirensis]|uniref:Solute carrier family 45, member 1/2/4 n=1 Tax=Kwoniella newhampshirensis TaxID=1651941 RepID=A0AAW0YRD0_9TREE
MTGGAFFAAGGGDEEYDLDENGVERHSVQWIGTAGVKGPRWAKMPLLTVGMLGIQCVWSIEMGYASPYLLDLGLSKSFMSLVFMAGPLSGLVVQPLIGIFADRSRSPLGRRRPFMLIGCAICVSAMMLLGWTREISSLVGGGKGLAIALAVWAIYLIDFSINAVMSTDRALVVDTLPPREQEEGSAWAGRMFGFGSVAGFFVGNLDLPPVLGFLGNTQLQILSFLTSAILMITHTFTSWAVSERVLLRDDRPQSKNGFKSNLKSIWTNMWSLPPGIRTVCIIQFFASLGWFPILFFTTVWVSEIYKSSVPMNDSTDPTVFAGQAVRSGSRALLLQSIVNIITSIGLPFLVSESGVQPEASHAYASLNGTGDAHDLPPNSAIWKRAKEDIESGGFVKRAMAWAGGVVGSVKDGSAWVVPIKGLTLIRVWWVSQFIFAGAMAASWFVTTVSGAYMIIAVTGFCWALSQWAPYSLLGELILIDGSIDRSQPISLIRTRQSADIRRSLSERQRAVSPLPHVIASSTDVSAQSTPLHSRHPSRSSFEVTNEKDRKQRFSDDAEKINASRGHSRPSSVGGLSPLIIQGESSAEPEFGSTVILRHSNDGLSDEEVDLEAEVDDDLARASPISPRLSSDAHGQSSGKGTADKAGVILGIHNVFLVLPQFIVTFLSAIIFYLMEPDKSLPHHRPGTIPISTNTTATLPDVADATEEIAKRTVEILRGRAAGMVGDASSPDAVGLIFRIGGISAAIGGWICWRLSKSWAKGQGI